MCACSSRTCVHISGKRGVLTPRAALSHLLARVILVVQRWTASLDERCPAGPRPTPRVLGATARHPGIRRSVIAAEADGAHRAPGPARRAAAPGGRLRPGARAAGA